MNASPLPEEQTLTESLAFADLLTWAASRPAWQRDALRRLVLDGTLTPGDVDDLADICLDPSLPHEPISQAHISTNTSAGRPIAILGIENPSGINALAAEQKLEFSKDNLTIIYGDNGSGKSGYVRVLKHACRTRDRDRHILRDVEDSEDTPQSATIKFARGADPDEFPWTPDAAAHGELSSVSIFDSRSANVHVQDTNAVAYIPQPMQILETLATACDQTMSAIWPWLALKL